MKADQGKRYDHEVAVAHTALLSNTWAGLHGEEGRSPSGHESAQKVESSYSEGVEDMVAPGERVTGKGFTRV